MTNSINQINTVGRITGRIYQAEERISGNKDKDGEIFYSDSNKETMCSALFSSSILSGPPGQMRPPPGI
jgi:hypothetical protein